ncbi:MAG: lamin tail domain-containing protein [Acidobacteriota bacterium]
MSYRAPSHPRTILVIASLFAAVSVAGASTVVDDWSKPVEPLTEYLAVAGHVLGGERDVVRSGPSTRWTWDGADGTVELDPTGLGGVDLTAGGFESVFVVGVPASAVAAELTLEVWTGAGRPSAVRVDVDAGVARGIEIPFSDFRGADLADVGAVAVELSAGLVPTSIATGSRIARSWSQRPAAGEDGGATLRTLSLTQTSGGGSEPLDFVMRPDSLLAGSVVVSQGQVLVGNGPGDTWLHVDLGVLAAGKTATVSFQDSGRGPAVRPATVVLQDGDTPAGGGGAAVDLLNPPMTSGTGAVGFVGAVAGDRFVWFDTGIAFLASDVMSNILSGGEAVMGVGDAAQFIYSPSIDGDDGVWTQAGLLAVENTAAPDQPAPTQSTFHSRPTMIPTGQAHWVAGLDPTGGTTSNARVLYTSTDGTPATITSVLQSGDMVDGLAISSGSSGILFDYWFSDDGAHHIHELDMASGSTADDNAIYFDGSLIARESLPNGSGDNWDNFDLMAVNTSGDHVFSGDTDGDTGSDEFIAYNGAIALREGDMVGGVALPSGVAVRALGLNDAGQAVHAWGSTGFGESVFFACDAGDLAGTSTLVLSTGDGIDTDGDMAADATVTDLNTFANSVDLAEDGRLFLEVELDFGGGEVEVILELDLPSCGGVFPVINEIDYDQDMTDEEEFIEIYNGTGAAVNLDTFSLELVNGNGGGAAVYDTIDLPNVMLADGDFYVVCGDAAMVPNCDLDVTPDSNLVQNGPPDAVALLESGVIVDTVSYEGDTGAPYTEGSGTGLEDDPAIDFFSISRTADGVDTDQNNLDFAGRCNSPGEANLSTTSGCMQIPVELLSFEVD